MEITIPRLSLVMLVGVSGSGKSSFAKKHFLETEVLSSDFCRALMTDNENDQTVTQEAFEILHFLARKRLEKGRLTVIDATNVKPASRRPLVALAREYHVIPVAIVFDLPLEVCQKRTAARNDRRLEPHVIPHQYDHLTRSLEILKEEGFRHIYILKTEEEANTADFKRVPLKSDRRNDHGPFDIIGDVHGCCDELEILLQKLGYEPGKAQNIDPLWGDKIYIHPQKRKLVFLGDLMDRGPRNLDTMRLARNMVQAGSALCVPGNHEIRLMHKLQGRNINMGYGLEKTLEELKSLAEGQRKQFSGKMIEFIQGLTSHYVLDDGKLVLAHAGMRETMQGRSSAKVSEFAMYGETKGESDLFGLPSRFPWILNYHGFATVVYGHTAVREPQWLNRTLNVDTGCVFGGKLAAWRYPEEEFVFAPANMIYSTPRKPVSQVKVQGRNKPSL